MADVNGILITRKTAEHNENLINHNSTFDRELNWTISGGGAVTHSNERVFAGRKSAKVNWTTMTAPLTFHTNDQQIVAPYTGYYIFTHEINEVSTNPTLPCGLVYSIKFYKNGSGSAFQVQEQSLENLSPNKWHCFAQRIFLNAGDVLTFKFEFSFGQTLLSTVVHYIDGLHFEIDDRKLSGIPTIYTKPLPIELIETLTFPEVTPGDTQVLPVEMTGAAELDFVEVVAPFLSQSRFLIYSADVTGTDSITVRCYNSGPDPITPTEGDFKFKIEK